jgi:hypothetical protein
MGMSRVMEVYHVGGPEHGETHEVVVFRSSPARDRRRLVELGARYWPSGDPNDWYYEVVGFMKDGSAVALYGFIGGDPMRGGGS